MLSRVVGKRSLVTECVSWGENSANVYLISIRHLLMR